jgi:autotransporter-associated beta strand protein
MKSKTTLQFHSTLATTIFCGALVTHLATSSASAQSLSWDGSDTITSGAQGGTGTWDSNTTANWWNGAANVVWPDTGTDNDATFGGTAGTVTISSVTANDLTFNSNGYILSGASTLTLNGTTPTITTNAGSPATIGNATATVIAGSAGLVKAGTNTLTLDGSAVNTFTGGLNLKGGTLALSLNNLATPTNLIDSGNPLAIGGSALAVTGKSTGNTTQTFASTNVESGNSAISLNRNGGTTGTLNLGTVTHSNGGIVSFTTSPSMTNIASTSEMIKTSNAVSPVNGGLAAWAFVGPSTTNGGRWVAVDASGTLKIVTANTTLGTNWSAVTDAANIYTTSLAVTLGANATAQGLQNAATGNIVVALGTNTLTVNGLSSINGTRTWSFTSSGAGGITIGSEKELILCGGGNFALGAPISNNAGGLSGLTHAGGGTATLTGVNAYTGQTTVNSGRLVVSTGGSINTSNGITVNGGTFVQNNTTTAITPTVTLQGGTVDGIGTINTVNVVDLATAKITNGNATTTALTVGNLTFSGDAAIDIRTAGSAGLAVSGTLTTTPANGKVTVNVTSAPAWSIGTTYNLISYDTLAGSLADFTKGTIAGIGGRQTAELVTNGNNIAVLIGGDKAVWTGAASGNWTTTPIGSPFNWKTQLGGADTEFLATDDVVFDDTAILTSVNIGDATVSPSTTTFDNSTKSYTLSGGGIATGTLTKNGTNTVSLTNTNTYTGATTINAGTLQVSSGTAVADAGLVTLGNVAGATFQVVASETIGALSGGGATGGAVSIESLQTLTLSAGTQTYAGTISGLGTLTSATTGGVQTLSGALSHSGGLNITGGMLTLGSSNNTYAGATTISSTKGLIVTANGALGATGTGNETTVTGTGSGAVSGALGLSGGITYSTSEKIVGSGVGNTGALTGFAAVQRGFIQSVSGNNTFAGPIELSADGVSRIGTQDGASLTLTGAITQATGITTANILFRVGSIAGDFVTLSNTGNSFGGNSLVFTGLNTSGSYAGVRLGASNALPMNLTISGFGGTSTASAASAALDLNGFNQTLNGLISGNGANSVMSIINMNTGTPSTLTLNPTADKSSGASSTVNTLVAGGDGLGVINLVKDGVFTQTLTGINTYTGTTTVVAGTLALVGGSQASPITVNNLASLGFTLGSGTTSTSTVTLDAGSTIKITGTPAPATSYTLLTTTATIIGTPVLAAPIAGFQLQVDGGNTLKLVPAAGYSSWATLNGAGPNLNDDHDSDGVSNGIEYFIGGPSGNTTGFTPLPGVVNTAGVLSVTWTKAADYTGTYGTDFVVETSATLTGSWTPAILDPNPGFTVTITGNDVKHTFPGGTKNFARLKVTGP